MIFEHEVFFIDDLIQDDTETDINRPIRKVIFLNDENRKRDEAIVAEAISLDVRGNYGIFLEYEYIRQKYMYRRINDDFESELSEISNDFVWSGNIFQITMKSDADIVILRDMTDEESLEYKIEKKNG